MKKSEIQMKPKIVIPDEVTNKIAYLCKIISEVEWSGILLYKIKEGSIKHPENLVIEIKDIIPMDRGTKTFTSFSLNETKRNFEDSIIEDRHIDYCEKHEDAIYWKMGLIHSHNTFDAFFSGVDISELQDNIKSHNFYLSLIVNNAMKPVAKIATLVEGESTGEYIFKGKDENGEDYVLKTTTGTHKKQIMVDYDCDIIFNMEAFNNVTYDLFYHNIISIVDTKERTQPYKNTRAEDRYNWSYKDETPTSSSKSSNTQTEIKFPMLKTTKNEELVTLTEDMKYLEKALIKALFVSFNSNASATNIHSAMVFSEHSAKSSYLDAENLCFKIISALGNDYYNPDLILHTEIFINYIEQEFSEVYSITEEVIEALEYLLIAEVQ